LGAAKTPTVAASTEITLTHSIVKQKQKKNSHNKKATYKHNRL